ncbi:MAG: hypothetical protein EBX51_07885, partial [Acidimicrobiia bacterium]|nr:hypothetical protein [Acidimicrobiia bacterium]
MSANWDDDFETWRNEKLDKQIENTEFLDLSQKWMQSSVDANYSYQFDWLGVPIIQMPGDLLVFQDIVFRTRPDLIIETGVARKKIEDWDAYREKLLSYIDPTSNTMNTITRQLQAMPKKRRIVFSEGEELEIIKTAVFLQSS